MNVAFQFDTDEEQKKQLLPFDDPGSLIEILLCTSDLQMIIDTNEGDDSLLVELLVQERTVASLLNILMGHFDSLLDDWYPEMGTRFVQNAKGDYLVNRLIPCHRCLAESNLLERSICHTFWLESLVMRVEKQKEIKCEKHGEISLHAIAPDLVRSRKRVLPEEKN